MRSVSSASFTSPSQQLSPGHKESSVLESSVNCTGRRFCILEPLHGRMGNWESDIIEVDVKVFMIMNYYFCFSIQWHWESIKDLENPLKTLLGLPVQDAKEEALHDQQEIHRTWNHTWIWDECWGGSQFIIITIYYYWSHIISLYRWVNWGRRSEATDPSSHD